MRHSHKQNYFDQKFQPWYLSEFPKEFSEDWNSSFQGKPINCDFLLFASVLGTEFLKWTRVGPKLTYHFPKKKKFQLYRWLKITCWQKFIFSYSTKPVLYHEKNMRKWKQLTGFFHQQMNFINMKSLILGLYIPTEVLVCWLNKHYLLEG